MKIRQNVRHWATKKALTTPVLRDVARDAMIDLHTRIFLKRADPEREAERRDHLDALFAGTIDTYLAALQAGYSEAEAREITHIQANFDFFNHGWTEMMEFPIDEVEPHYDRYADFFQTHDITIDRPLGEFRPETVPTAPSTPDKLEGATHPHSEGGFADDVYVEDETGAVRVGGADEPDDVSATKAPGVSDGD
jgi:hypothetical protein